MRQGIQHEFTCLPGGEGVQEEGVQVGSRAWPLGLSISGGYPLFPAGTPCRNQGAVAMGRTYYVERVIVTESEQQTYIASASARR